MLDSLDCCPPDSSDNGFLQARILDWIVAPPPGYLPDNTLRDGTRVSSVSCISRRVLYLVPPEKQSSKTLLRVFLEAELGSCPKPAL